MSTIETDTASGARPGAVGNMTDDSARQAPPGRRVLYVLIGVTLGAVAAIFLVARSAGFF